MNEELDFEIYEQMLEEDHKKELVKLRKKKLVSDSPKRQRYFCPECNEGFISLFNYHEHTKKCI